MNKTTTIMMAFLIMLTMQVTAIGVTPALNTIVYREGQTQTVDFTITNTEDRPMKVALVQQGDIPMQLENDIIELKPLETKKSSYTFTMANLESGTRSSSVLIQEVQEETVAGIGATVQVTTTLHLKVPYTGKQIDADI